MDANQLATRQLSHALPLSLPRALIVVPLPPTNYGNSGRNARVPLPTFGDPPKLGLQTTTLMRSRNFNKLLFPYGGPWPLRAPITFAAPAADGARAIPAVRAEHLIKENWQWLRLPSRLRQDKPGTRRNSLTAVTRYLARRIGDRR